NTKAPRRGDAGHSSEITSLVFCNDGKQLISVGGDNYIKVWDTMTGRLLDLVQCGAPSGWADRRSALAVVGDGKGIVTASKTGDLRLYELESGRLLNARKYSLGPFDWPNYWTALFAISWDGKLLASALEANPARADGSPKE